MSKKDDNINNELNKHLIKQFLSAYKSKQQYYWSEDEFEYILRFCHDNKKIPMMHYALSLALKYYPDNADFHFSAGKYFLAIQNARKALFHFKKFLLDHKDNDFVIFEMCFCWNLLNAENEAIEVLNDYINNFNAESAIIWFALGTIYIKKEEIENAINAFEYSLALNPDSIATYINLGDLYCMVDRYDKAFLIYYEALKFDDKDPILYTNIGECCFYLEDYEKTIEYENIALNLDNTCEYAYYYLAKVYFKYERFFLAEGYIRKAIESNDKISEFFSLSAYINLSLDEKLLAEKDYLKAISLDPSFFECYLDIAIFYVSEERADEAIKIIEDNISNLFDDEKIQALYLLSACYYMAGQKQEAYTMFANIEVLNKKLLGFMCGNFDDFIGDQVIMDLIKDIE